MALDRIRRNSTGRIVILDTSAIFMVFEYSVDLEQELTRLLGSFDIIVPAAVVEEIQKLFEYGSGKKKQLAKMSLQFIKRYTSKEIGHGDMVDDLVISAAKELQGIVVTNDKELRKRLKSQRIRQIFLRQKQYLMME